MENTCTEKEKVEVVTGVATIWAEFCKKPSFGSTALYPLLTCLIFFHLPLIESSAADTKQIPQQRYRVVDISPIPNPKKTSYPDCLTHILCQPITQTGSSAGNEVDLVFFAFRKKTLYPAAGLKPGDEVSLSAIPFHEAPQQIRDLRQANDLSDYTVQVLFVSQWDRQDEFVSGLTATEAAPSSPTSNRDLIIQTLIAHQGKVTGGVNQNFFFWTHVPAMYETDFWKIQPTQKNALGPLKSILLFKQHLEEKNIDLIFVPIPRSTTIYPGIATNIEYDPAIDGRINFAVRDLMDSLEAGGVTCIDLTPTFLANTYQEFDGNRYPIYRRNDTHWAPSGVRMAAGLIVNTIKKRPSFNNLTSRVATLTLIENVALEELSYSMPEFERPPSRRQPSEMQPVYRIDSQKDSGRELLNGNLPNAEIHLLGDSFSNAYGTGVGEAGLHPHLVYALKTPVNKIASGSGGSAISPNQLARNADLSKAKIVIWAVCESFLAAPDIWSDIPLDRPDTLMLDKLLSQAQLSHNAFAFHLATNNTQGSYIAVGDPSVPDSLPEKSSILWKNVRITDEGISPSFTASTWVLKTGDVSDGSSSKKYPLSWEIWINGALYKSQNSPPDRDIFQRLKWNVKLNKFAGQTLDIELICRRLKPSQALPGQPCWILPEINGAILGSSTSKQSTPETQSTTELTPDQSDQATTASSINHSLIALIAILLFGTGIATAYALRRNRKTP